MTEEHRIFGLRVRIENSRADIDSAEVLARLERALDLIATYAPRRLRRMKRDLDGIVVRRFPCRGAFFHQERECLVELTFTVNPRHSLAEIAASIVHEATHARLATMCGPLPNHHRPREERLCRKAELEFGLAIPDGQVVVERARVALAMADQDVAPAVDWVEASRRVQAVDRGALGA
ncbi:MAG TPA: hypothetical protein VFH26_11550 [Gemmatimonadales bacterium]|nr:hypothetical protein [Gemmatimonadales bacterium]